MEKFLIINPYGEATLVTKISDEDRQLEADGELEIYKVTSDSDITVSRAMFSSDDLTAEPSLQELETEVG